MGSFHLYIYTGFRGRYFGGYIGIILLTLLGGWTRFFCACSDVKYLLFLLPEKSIKEAVPSGKSKGCWTSDRNTCLLGLKITRYIKLFCRKLLHWIFNRQQISARHKIFSLINKLTFYKYHFIDPFQHWMYLFIIIPLPFSIFSEVNYPVLLFTMT